MTEESSEGGPLRAVIRTTREAITGVAETVDSAGSSIQVEVKEGSAMLGSVLDTVLGTLKDVRKQYPFLGVAACSLTLAVPALFTSRLHAVRRAILGAGIGTYVFYPNKAVAAGRWLTDVAPVRLVQMQKEAYEKARAAAASEEGGAEDSKE
eukprot:tig00022080_g23799.t1